METDLLSKEVTKMLPLKKLRVSKVYEPTGLSQASNARQLVSYRSHAMSEYGKNKKVARKMQLCSFQAFSD